MEITVDYSPRRSGKTHRLVVRASEDELCTVCRDRSEVDRVTRYAVEIGMVIHRPIAAEDFQYRRYDRNLSKNLLIDEAADVLQRMSVIPIYGLTLTAYCRNPVIVFFETLFLGNIKVTWFKPIPVLRFNYFRHYTSCKRVIRIDFVCIGITLSRTDKELTALYGGL